MTVAALYIDPRGPYPALLGPENCWDEARDARLYAGPWPVVAHPPCARWGRYWFGGPTARERRQLGDDGGCFASAIAAVRRWGGVLEHPEASKAWLAFGLIRPLRSGGWSVADEVGGWTCCVEQGAYGHRARKATWLYAVGIDPPVLRWRASGEFVRMDPGYHSTAERRADRAAGITPPCRLSARQRALTPADFAILLVDIARSARVTPR